MASPDRGIGVTLSTLSGSEAVRGAPGVAPSSTHRGAPASPQIPVGARLSYRGACCLCVPARRGRRVAGSRLAGAGRCRRGRGRRRGLERRHRAGRCGLPRRLRARRRRHRERPPRAGARRLGASSSTSARWRSSALVSYASIGWSLTPQTSYGDANRWLVAAAAAGCGILLASLRAARSRRRCGCSAPMSLPLIAYAIQQRAHGVFFQTSPRLQGVLGYPNAIGAYAALAAPRALWLASSPQRLRRAAGCATLSLLVLGARPRLLAWRPDRRDPRLRRLARSQRATHRERRGRCSPCSP